jgi:LuxR family maltose regulon positive regulatory protein
MTSAPLIRTKLHWPSVPRDAVDRGRLIELMENACKAPLTLVSAPAGYGKSVLVAQWAQRCDTPVAWLSLDESESDLELFLQYFIASVHAVFPDACPSTAVLAGAPEPPPVPVLAASLLNEIDAIDQPLVMVVDDFHRIDPSSTVNELIEHLIEHPWRLARLVIITRRDPPIRISGLLAGAKLAEVRLEDLRFNDSETAELLASATRTPVSDEALDTLQREIEGWAVGLRLTALALRLTEIPDTLIQGLGGGLPQIQEYLLREVLAGLSPGLREAMLSSAILDRFCAELLEAICPPDAAEGSLGLAGHEIVDQLNAANLFTIGLDAGGRWFRYHHLFQDLLERQLRQSRPHEDLVALHSRASAWFEGEGSISESLKHAMAAEDLDRVIELFRCHRHPTINADRWYEFANWLALVPDKLVLEHAELAMSRVWILMHHFRFETVLPLLDHIETLIGGDPNTEEIRGEIALCRGYSLFFLGDGAASLQLMEEALSKIPVSYTEARAQSEVIFGMSKHMVGHKEEAIRFLDELLVHYDSPEPIRKGRLLITYVFIHVLDGDLFAAEQANRRLLEFVEHEGLAYNLAWAHYMQGMIHLHRCEWQAAIDFLGRSVAQRFIHFKRAATDSITGLMLAQQARGLHGDARGSLQVLNDFVASQDDPALWPLVSSAEARLAAMQEPSQSDQRQPIPSEPPPEGAMLWWLDIPAISRCRALIAEGSPTGAAHAESLLREWVKTNEAHHNTIQLIKILTLLAVACDKQGNAEEGLEVLDQAATMARPGCVWFPFVELGVPMAAMLRRLVDQSTGRSPAEDILAAVERHEGSRFADLAEVAPEGSDQLSRSSPTSARSANLEPFEVLTNRELDVLELVAERLQNKEIASRLGISAHTVSYHLKSIYAKLDVKNRRQAVAAAIATGILDVR